MVQSVSRRPQVEVTRANGSHVELEVDVGTAYKFRARGPASELDTMTDHLMQLLREVRRRH